MRCWCASRVPSQKFQYRARRRSGPGRPITTRSRDRNIAPSSPSFPLLHPLRYTARRDANTMSASRTPSRRRSAAEWPIDPALDGSSPSPGARGSPRPARTLHASQSQNEKEDELVEMEPEQQQDGAGPSRSRRKSALTGRNTAEASQNSQRTRRRSTSDDGGAGVIDPPAPKRRRTHEERQRSYAQGWETRRHNIWAERVLPTYSTGESGLAPRACGCSFFDLPNA